MLKKLPSCRQMNPWISLKKFRLQYPTWVYIHSIFWWLPFCYNKDKIGTIVFKILGFKILIIWFVSNPKKKIFVWCNESHLLVIQVWILWFSHTWIRFHFKWFFLARIATLWQLISAFFYFYFYVFLLFLFLRGYIMIDYITSHERNLWDFRKVLERSKEYAWGV